MKTNLSQPRKNAGLSALVLTLAALCPLLCAGLASAQTTYTLSTLTTGGSWANSANWNNPSTAGPGNTSGDLTDIAILPLGTLTAPWEMTLDSSPTIANLTVTSSGSYGVTLDAGTPGTSTLTLDGATPAFMNNVLAGQTLTITAPFSLDTPNTLFTNNGTGNLTISTPTNGFFANLNPNGGLSSTTNLIINNVYTNLPPLSQLKTGAGQLTLNLVGAATSTFFTNQNNGSLGGNGFLQISNVDLFSSAAGTAQSLTNNGIGSANGVSTNTLELDLDASTPSAFFGPSSFGGLGAAPGKVGLTTIRYIRGANTLASTVHIDTSANSSSGNILNFIGNGGTAASAVINGGTWNVPGNLYFAGSITLNIDSNMGSFTNGGNLVAGSGNSQQSYAAGNNTVNFNPGSTLPVSLNNVTVNSQGGSVGIFNMMSGSVTNLGTFALGATGHNTDNSTSYLNITNGSLTLTNASGLAMSPVTTPPSGSVGPKEYSFLTITNTGVLNIVAPGAINAGRVIQADTASAPIYSESTISLGGGTLQLGTPIARQPVATMVNGSSANWVKFYFNGGTLLATTNLPQVFTNFGTANSTADGVYIAAGGAVINNGGFNVGISNNLSEVNPGSGLTSLGSGTLTLSGANTYTGPTVVSAGRLVTTTASTGGGSYSVADGATNQVVVASQGSTLNVSSLTLGTSSGATMEFNNANLANPTAPIIAVSSPLVLKGTIPVNIIYAPGFSTGTITLMTYPSETVTGAGFTLRSLPPGMVATLNDNGTSLKLNISSVTTSLTWNGNVGSVWDINDSGNNNWIGLPSSTAAYYTENGSVGLPVTFNDTANGSTSITLGVAVHPAGVTINNSALNYTITGAGSIGGPLPLTKSGTGTFTLGVANNFTNAILNGGTLGLSGGNNRLPVTDVVTFGAAAALDLGGNSQSITNLVLSALASGTATVTNGNLTLTTTGGLNFTPNVAATSVTTEDLSGLATLTYNQPGHPLTFNGAVGANSTLNLAGTNTITASLIYLANSGLSAAAPHFTAAILLGQSNVINTTNITLGGYRNASGLIAFNPGLTNPTLTLRGTNGGVSSVGSIIIGQNSNGAFPPQAIDTTAGTIDAIVNNLYVVNANSGGGVNGNPICTMSMSNGTFNAGVIYLNNIFGTPTSPSTATFNQDGGTVLSGTLGFNNTLTNGTPTFTSAYNLGNGIATAGLLSAGNITIVGGLTAPNVASQATLNFTNGTIENYDPALGQPGSAPVGGYTTKTNLTISGLAGGGAANDYRTLNIVLAPIGTQNFYAESNYSITESNTALISGNGGLTANGPGTVTLYGANTYTGNTTVSAGTLLVNGSLASGSTVTVSGGTLGGNGIVNGATTVGAGAYLSAGNNQIGTLNIANNLTLNAASTNIFVVTPTGISNQVAVAGQLAPSGSVVQINTAGTQLAPGTYNNLFTYGATDGTQFAATPVFGTPQNGTAASIVNDGAGHINLVVVNTYMLTYTAGAGGTLVGATSQTVASGGSGSAVTPVPNPGYHFVNWSDSSTANPRKDINVVANINVTANFAINTYTITTTQSANGTISPSGTTTVTYGANQTFTITPATGYQVATLTVDGSSVTPANSYTFNNVITTHTITATYALIPTTITVAQTANGTISPGTTTPVYAANQTFTITPATGYQVATLTVDGSSVTPANSYTFNNVTTTHTITATFGINSYQLIYNGGAHGTISGTTPQTVAYLSSGTPVTAVANAGYGFSSWSDGLTTATRTDTAGIGGTNVTANYTNNNYTLTYNGGAHGTISGTTPQTVAYLSSGTPVTAVANAGYGFSSWSDGLTTATRTDTAGIGGTNVTANYTNNNYTLTYNGGAHGTISGTTPQTVAYLSSGTPVTAVANAGYGFSSWSDGLTTATRTDTAGIGGTNVTANYTNNNYTLTYNGGAHGTISGTTPQTVAYLSSGTPVTAVANAGYGFSSWSDGLTTATRTDTAGIGGTNVTANYTNNNYTLTYNAGANGTISGTTPQTVNYNASGSTITAVPNTGYHFVNWSDSSTANPRTDTNVVANLSVTANFAINTYTITASAGANGLISPNGVTVVNYGGGQSYTITTNVGFIIADVLVDGSSVGPVANYDFSNVTTNHTIGVWFALACTSPTIAGGISPGSTNVTAFSPVVLTLTNVSGTDLAYQWQSNNVNIAGATSSSYTNLSVTVANAGSYVCVVTNNCGAITSSVALLTVSPQTPLIATAPTAAATITYGQTLASAGLTGGWVTNAAGATVSGNFLYTSPATVPDAGTAAQDVTFTPTDTNNYNTVSTSVNVTVERAPLSVTASNVFRLYGQANPVFGGIIVGIRNDDDITAIYATTATSNSSVNTYPIIPTLVDPDGRLENYIVTYNNGTLTIGKAPSVVTWTNPASIGYGTALSGAQLNASANVPGNLNYTPPVGTVLNAGTNTLTAVFTPTDPVNYIGATNTVSLVVSPAALTVTANSTNRFYGQPNPVFTGILTGVTNGDSLTATYATTATTSSSAGSYPIIPTLVDPNGRLVNYTVTTNNGTLTIGKAPSIVTWTNPASIGYGTALSGAQLNASANVPGNLNYTPPVGTVLNAGTNTLTAVFTPTDPVNYIGATNTVSLVVSPAALTVTANNLYEAYNGVPFSGGNGVTYYGFVNGETAAVLGGTLGYGGPSQGAVNVGSYSLTPSGLTATNYALNFINGTLYIGLPPQITGQPTNEIVPLGGTAQFTVSATGTPTLTYQWWFNQTNLLALATNSTLTLTNIALVQAGDYSAVVQNAFGSVTSTSAVLSLVSAPTISGAGYFFSGTNSVTGSQTVTLNATVNPDGLPTTAYFQYGLTTSYAGASALVNLPASSVGTNVSASLNSIVPGVVYHWQVVASNSLGSVVTLDQTFYTPSIYPPGETNADGVVDQNELNAVLANYWPNSPWVTMTNVAGLGTMKVQFALTNANNWDFSVLVSTNLKDWQYLTNAIPMYQFNDPQATNKPTRYYRLRWP